MNLGVQLRVYRKSKGHSVQKVSELTGIPADRIYKWEKGTRPSDAEDLLKIRAYMGGEVESAPTVSEKLETGRLTSSLPGSATLQDHISLYERWLADREAKYQDSNKRELALVAIINNYLRDIPNLVQGQQDIKEQFLSSAKALAELMSDHRDQILSAGRQAPSEKGRLSRRKTVKEDGKGKDH
jgi:transcriptional regulator with XRE-family HTH domain